MRSDVSKGQLYRDGYAISAALGTLWAAPAMALVFSGYNFTIPAASLATAYYFYDGSVAGLLNAYLPGGSVFAAGFQAVIIPQIIDEIGNLETQAATTWNKDQGLFWWWIKLHLSQ